MGLMHRCVPGKLCLQGHHAAVMRGMLEKASKKVFKRSSKKDENHCQREKMCVSTNESEMLSDQNDEIAQRAGG